MVTRWSALLLNQGFIHILSEIYVICGYRHFPSSCQVIEMQSPWFRKVFITVLCIYKVINDFQTISHILPSSYQSCHTGLWVQQKMNVETVACACVLVSKAEIQTTDNPGGCGLWIQVRCPSHCKVALSVKTICTTYRWN